MKVIDKFSKNLFWDIDPANLDSVLHTQFIVERVVSKGRLQDWYQLNHIYLPEQIKKEVIKIRYLDDVTWCFCSTYFNIPKSKFKCYKQQPSIQELWKY
jgi:hypothetical protein